LLKRSKFLEEIEKKLLPYYSVAFDDKPIETVIKKGAAPSIYIESELRGKKALTTIYNLHLLQIPLERVSRDCSRLFASSSSIAKVEPGQSHGTAGDSCVQVQGNVATEVASYLISDFCIPKKCVLVLDKCISKKKK
jgi:translation initiation factor 1 (eIF-1/SUI1)